VLPALHDAIRFRTPNYKFCWGMGGENHVYTDMDLAPIQDLR